MAQAYRAPKTPSLGRMLARADVIADPGRTAPRADSFHERLFGLFDLLPETPVDLPVAAVTRLADGGAINADWRMRADPVSLLPQGGGLILQPAEQLRLSREPAESLRQDILAVFAADGWVLEAPVPQRWYLSLPAPPDLRTYAPGLVTGRDIHGFLPQGPDAKAWHVFMNEIQILLHTAGVNIERESRGYMPVNSLWFWGGGRLPQPPAARWSQVWSDEPVSHGLAILSGTPHGRLDDPAAVLESAATAGRRLVVFDTAFAGGVVDDWSERMEWLDSHWLALLLALVRSGGLGSLSLYSDTGRGYSVTRSNARRWWRRQHALSDYV